MSLISLVVALIVVGVLLWLVNTYIPIAALSQALEDHRERPCPSF